MGVDEPHITVAVEADRNAGARDPPATLILLHLVCTPVEIAQTINWACEWTCDAAIWRIKLSRVLGVCQSRD